MTPIQDLACPCGRGRVEGKIGNTKEQILASINRCITGDARIITCLGCGTPIEEWGLVDQTHERRLELSRRKAALVQKYPERFISVKDKGQA